MISDLNFHLTIRTILQGENFLFSKENEDTYNPTTNGDSFVFFFHILRSQLRCQPHRSTSSITAPQTVA